MQEPTAPPARTARRVTPTRLVLAPLLVALAVVVGACSADGGSDAARGTSAPRAEAGGGPGGTGAGADAAEPGNPAAGPADTVVDGPRTVRRGGIRLQVEDLAEAAARVREQAAAAGGYVSDEAIGSAGDGFAQGVSFDGSVGDHERVTAPPLSSGPGEGRLVARVPTARMVEAVDALAAVGDELGRWSTETVVESELVDLESRVASKAASLERVRGLLSQATSLADVVALESELADREADLESLQARLGSLSGRAAMATVTVVLTTPDRTGEVEDRDGFLGGLRAGWEALGGSTVVLLTALGAVLPFALLAGALTVPFVVWRRRVRRSADGPASSGSVPSRPVAPGTTTDPR